MQAREEFRLILEWGLRLGLIDLKSYSTPAEGPRTLRTILGATVETKSAQHTERLASVAPDMVVLCEPGQMSSEVYDMVLGRLSQKRGDLLLIGTLEDSLGKPRWQWYEDLALEWMGNGPGSRQQSFSVPTWSNRSIYPLGLADPELQAIKNNPRTAEYTWNRRYAGKPEGVNHPVFPLLWELPEEEFLMEVLDFPEWVDGCVGVDYGCLPLDTQILTRDGWKQHDEVQIGELVASCRGWSNDRSRRVETNLELVWTPLLGKVYRPMDDMVRITAHGFRFDCTPDHAWLSRHRRTKRVARLGLDVTSPNRFLVTAAPMRGDGDDLLDCTPGEAAVLGWLVTDGWTQGDWQEGKFSAIISQKTKVDALLVDLEDSGIPYAEHKPRSWGVRCFRLHTASVRNLFMRVGWGGKSSLPRIVTYLSAAARSRMLNAMLLAEGSPERGEFTQNEGPVLEAFITLSALAGKRASISDHSAPGSDKVCLRSNYRRTEVGHWGVVPIGRAPVWCPTVEFGSVVARQGYNVSVTGNTTYDHPSAIVAVTVDQYGRLWVRAGWQGVRADPREIDSVVSRMKQDFGIWNVSTDPNQRFMADVLDGTAATAKGKQPTETRFSLANGLLESGHLLFDVMGENVREIKASMRSMGRRVDARGRLIYDRPLGDDLAQALMYAVEFLRIGDQEDIPVFDLGGARMRYAPSTPQLDEGRA